MTARRLRIDKDTDLLSLFGPAPTDEQRQKARELMAPYLEDFQQAVDAQSRQDFGIGLPGADPQKALSQPQYPEWVNDAARQITKKDDPREIAAIIANHVRPLVALLGDLAASVEPLVTALQESRREHYHCDDSVYCCPQCRNPDHPGNDLAQRDDCNCGATEWNEKVDQVLGASQVPVSYTHLTLPT